MYEDTTCKWGTGRSLEGEPPIFLTKQATFVGRCLFLSDECTLVPQERSHREYSKLATRIAKSHFSPRVLVIML